MPKMVTKLFRKPEDATQAVADLKAKGYEAEVIKGGASSEKELVELGLSGQAADYYQIGLSLGGTIVKVAADEAQAEEINKLLLAIGFDELRERPAQWSTSPGFVLAERMSATNPIDAQMSGDFRKY